MIKIGDKVIIEQVTKHSEDFYYQDYLGLKGIVKEINYTDNAAPPYYIRFKTKLTGSDMSLWCHRVKPIPSVNLDFLDELFEI